MKSIERHKLKENEFARSVAHARDVIGTRGRDMAWIAGAAAVVLVLVGGYSWWHQSHNAKANTALAEALAVYEAPVVPPAAPAAGSPVPVQESGTFQTEHAKLEAALPKFMETATQFPGADAGIVARYQAAGILAQLGRFGEAEQRYQEVVAKAGQTIYARTARLGLAESQVAQAKYDSAINIYRELSTDTTAQLPVDGILMQLGRTYMKAGKKEEAARAFNRVIEEFPQSGYTTDARQEMAEAKKG